MSSISIPSLSRLPIIAASFMALLITGSALAQGERLAAECVQQMHKTAHNTGQTIHTIARRGIGAIQAIDDNDGTDEQLIAAARQTHSAVAARAEAGTDRINAAAERCIDALVDMDADRSLIRRVNHARRMSLGVITDAAQSANRRVHTALHRALNN